MTIIDDAEMPTKEPLDQVAARRLHDTLSRSVELGETFEQNLRIPLSPSCRLRQDEALGNAASAFNTASVALVGALDHIQTWYSVVAADLTRFPLPLFSHYTLARGAYEPALIVLWLLDAEADSEGRISRGYAAQLRSLEDMRRFQCDAGMTGESANATALYQRLFAAARADGYVTVDAKGKERLRVVVPDMIALFNRYDQPYSTLGVPAWLYRVLSGYTHGREWAMLHGATESDVEGLDTGMTVIRADWQLLCNLAQRTVSVVERALMLHLEYRTR